MTVINKSVDKLIKVAFIFGGLLFLGSIAASPGLFDDNNPLGLSFKFITVFQFLVSLIFLFSAYKLKKDLNESHLKLFKAACLLGIIYVAIFTMIFIYRNYEHLGISFISAISYLIMAAMLGGPFVWCLHTAKKYTRVQGVQGVTVQGVRVVDFRS